MPNTNSAVVRPSSARRRISSGTKVRSPWHNGINGPRAAGDIETLESRTLLSVSQDAAGFTVVTPAADSRVVYVSSSAGNDANAGTSPAAPFRSIARAKLSIRNGYPDQLLLNRGDKFRESLGTWTASGRSAEEPVVIGTYGSGARPTMATGINQAVSIGQRTHTHDIAILGIRFYSDGHDPKSPNFRESANPDGLSISGNVSRVLVEDCEFSTYRNNVVAFSYWGRLEDFTLRRSVILDAYSDTGQNSTGVYMEDAHRVSFVENVMDHNGWYEGKSGAQATMYNHNVYLRTSVSGVVARGNVFAHGSSFGMQARSGGVIEDNLFYFNATGLAFGMVNGQDAVAGGVVGRVSGNVFTGNRSISASLPRGVGIEVGNIRPNAGVSIDNNLFVDGDRRAFGAINLNVVDSAYGNATSSPGIRDLTIADNTVVRWYRGLAVSNTLVWGASGYRGLGGLTVRNNEFQQTYSGQVVYQGPAVNPGLETWSGNTYNALSSGTPTIHAGGKSYNVPAWEKTIEPGAKVQAVAYPNGSAGVSTYAGDFLAGARRQFSGSWDGRYTTAGVLNYLKAAYGVDGFPGGETPSPTPTPTPVPTPTPTPIPTPVPTPTPAPTPTLALTSLTLVNAATDLDIGTLADNPSLNLAVLGRQLSIRAAGDPSIKSVNFTVDGLPLHTDSTAPFSLVGDANGDYAPWTPDVGTRQLVITPYSEVDATGTAGVPTIINLNVTDSGTVPTPTPTPVPTPTPISPLSVAGFTLINAATDQSLGALTEGQVLDFATIGGELNVRADAGGAARSVVFRLDGVKFSTEGAAPFALAGDSGGNYHVWTPKLGFHQLTVTAYSGTGGTGTAGTPLTVNFSIVNTFPPNVPTPTPTPTAAPELSGLTLISALTNASLGALSDGQIIDLRVTPKINVRADALRNVASVSFALDGVVIRTETTAPYALAGDDRGIFLPWTPAVGTHTLRVTPFGGPGGTGAIGPAIELIFTVIA